LRQEAQERRKRLEPRKPFIGTLRVNESRPAELGQQPAPSLAWGGATLTAKRSGYRHRSGDASIGGQGETVEVSQPHVQEVIPMISKKEKGPIVVKYTIIPDDAQFLTLSQVQALRYFQAK
jgi:hypothetical protein